MSTAEGPVCLSTGVVIVECLNGKKVALTRIEMEAVLRYLPRFAEVDSSLLLSQLPKLVQFYEEQHKRLLPLSFQGDAETASVASDDVGGIGEEGGDNLGISVCSSGYCENALMRAKLRRQVRELKKQNAMLQTQLREAISQQTSGSPGFDRGTSRNGRNQASGLPSGPPNRRSPSHAQSNAMISKLQHQLDSKEEEFRAREHELNSELEASKESLALLTLSIEQVHGELKALAESSDELKKKQSEDSKHFQDQIKSLEAVIEGKENILREASLMWAEQKAELMRRFYEKETQLSQELAQLAGHMDQQQREHSHERATLEQVICNAQEEVANLHKQLEATTDELKTLEASILSIQDHQLPALVKDQLRMRADVQQQHHLAVQEVMHFVQTEVQEELFKREKAREAAELRFHKELTERRRLNEEVHTLKGNIRVFCRVRPGTQEINTQAFCFPAENRILANSEKEFAFDKVFQPASVQEDVFREIEPLVDSVMDGYNACVFAYGQTGTGKTFTMAGPAENPGVNPRAVKRLFHLKGERHAFYEYELRLSMVEIYNDKLRDLLIEPSDEITGLEIRMKQSASGKTQMEIENLKTVPVSSPEDVEMFIEKGTRNRSVASTLMNIESSRSHLLLFLEVQGTHKVTMERMYSKLCLADLAGSERLSRSGAVGDRKIEAQHINKSLSALGDVVHALQTKSKHIPFRNSKLTYILQDMLGGGAKTLMVLQVSPDESDLPETICSLNFAARVSQVSLGAVKRSSESGDLVALQRRADDLQRSEAQLKKNLSERQQEIEEYQARQKAYELQLLELNSKIQQLQEGGFSFYGSDTASEITVASTIEADNISLSEEIPEQETFPVSTPKVFKSSLQLALAEQKEHSGPASPVTRHVSGSSLQAAVLAQNEKERERETKTGRGVSPSPSSKSSDSVISNASSRIRAIRGQVKPGSFRQSPTLSASARKDITPKFVRSVRGGGPPASSSSSSGIAGGQKGGIASSSSFRSTPSRLPNKEGIPSSSSFRAKSSSNSSPPVSSSPAVTTVPRRRSVMEATTAAYTARKAGVAAAGTGRLSRSNPHSASMPGRLTASSRSSPAPANISTAA